MLKPNDSDFEHAWCADPVWETVLDFARAQSYGRAFYLHLPPPGSGDAPSCLCGGDAAAAARYLGERLYRSDPRLRHALRSHQPFRLETIDRADGAPTAMGGVGVPVFGPAQRNGYFEFGPTSDGRTPGPDDLSAAHWVAQLAHLRFCAVAVAGRAPAPDLTVREREILAWVARGKSNDSIAVIVGISRHTVDTYLRRIYEKLGVNDRITATLRGLAHQHIDVLD